MKEARSRTDDYGAAVAPERALWVGVLVQAIADSRLAPFSPTIMQVQRDARRWLTVPSPDLSWMLTMVGVDPGFWFSHALPELREQWRVLDDARDLGLRRRRGAGVAPWAAEAQALALG